MPPVVTDAVRRIASEWEFVPRGWSEEQAAVEGWNDDSVAKGQKRHWPTLVRNLEGPGPLGVSHFPTKISRDDPVDHNTMMSYGYVLALTARRKDTITVLDWGGGVGHYHLYSKALLPDLRLDYHCHDVPRLCRLGRKLQPDVQFYESPDAALARSYDLVLSSSSLHYFQDWREVLAKLASATSVFLYVARLQTIDREASFVVAQAPYSFGYFTRYLSWCLNRREFLSCAEGVGLELVREFAFAEDWSVRGAPEAPRSRGFLFRALGARTV
jgi:putative methyltransferase (TIGR04325 family)